MICGCWGIFYKFTKLGRFLLPPKLIYTFRYLYMHRNAGINPIH
nr:MAG TPA: hypothetical protein [Caudoviricetes sp.]